MSTTNPTPKIMNNKKDAAPIDLEIFESNGRGVFRRRASRKAICVGPRVSYISDEAAKAMDVRIPHAERALLARNPADGSIYLGIVPSTAARRGYAIRRTKGGAPFCFMTGSAKDKVAGGLYEIVGAAKELQGARWYPLHPIAD